MQCKNHRTAFANHMSTDGFAINFMFARKKSSPTQNLHDVQLEFEDFTEQEVQDYFQLVAVDPGRTQIFTASYGSGEEPHEVRRMSTKEYYTMTGSKKTNQALQKEKIASGINIIENNIPTPKTADINQYHCYMGYLLRHERTLTTFYNHRRAETRFRNYQGVQRAREEMVKVFLDGGKKYNKCKRKFTSKNRKKRKKELLKRKRQNRR
jgi:hypothetical protein